MAAFAALLRGINVGGNNMVKMTELTALFTSSGYRDVKTYLNSGNVVFQSDELDPGLHEDRLEKAILAQLGLKLRVKVRSKQQLQETVEGNPFAAITVGPDRILYVSFLFRAMTRGETERLRALSSEWEQIAPAADRIYTLLGRALFPKSVLSRNPLKLETTVRNWNTITNVLALMQP